MARNRTRRGRQGRRRNFRRRIQRNPNPFPPMPRGSSNQSILIKRHEMITHFPGGGGQDTITDVVMPLSPLNLTVASLVPLYSEYRFRYAKFFTKGRNDTEVGAIWFGFEYDPPTSLSDIRQASQLEGFNTGDYMKNITTHLNLRLMQRPWYRCQDDNQNHMNDPTFVQAWLHYGAYNSQNGVIGADLYVSYAIEFRGQRFAQPIPAATLSPPTFFSVTEPFSFL